MAHHGPHRVVNIFDQYDLMLFSMALKQIQADLAIPEAQLGELGAIVRMGALPAFLFGVIADRVGRRRVLLLTIVGGLWAESVLFGVFGSHWTAVSMLVVGAFAAPILVLLFFPETSGRELEEISPEKSS